ncbi:MAG: hypothetical protein AB9819_08015 [Methanomassiliicoccales archaeon]
MNRCERWSFCPLGKLAESVGCRKPHCPKAEMAHNTKLFTKDTVIPGKRRKE